MKLNNLRKEIESGIEKDETINLRENLKMFLCEIKKIRLSSDDLSILNDLTTDITTNNVDEFISKRYKHSTLFNTIDWPLQNSLSI